MVSVLSMIVLLTPLPQSPPVASPAQTFQELVTRQGDKLMEGDREFRFISFHVPNLHYIEDNLPFEEMRDLSNVFAHAGDPSLDSKEARQAKEDMSRIAGGGGSEIVYRTTGPMQASRAYAFYLGDVTDFEFQVSGDGIFWTGVPASRTDFCRGSGDYNYCEPPLYEVRTFPAGTLFFKILFKTQAQVGRVEIEHGGGQKP
jgi:hypothetical protein